MPRSTSLAALAALTVVSTACVQVYPAATTPAPQASASGTGDQAKADTTKPFKKWDDVLKDTRAIDGYFRTHLKRDNTLYVELRPDQLERDFGMILHFSRGVGDFNLHQGLPLSDTRLMQWRREGDKIYLVDINPRFTADPGSPMRVSLEGNVGHSIVEAFKIESEHETSKHLLVDVTEFFVSDYANLGNWIKFYYDDKPVSFSKDRSYVDAVLGFPRNVEIDAAITYTASDFPRFGGAGVSDFRSIPVAVRYSLFALPDVPMAPRLADDRMGHFLDAVRDFSRDRQETPFVRYVNRWRLEKRDHSVAISEPVEPIVFYIDRTVPHEYRRYVKEGVEAWNKAYEAAGFRNAIVAREAPDDTTWSAEDIRFSTIRWTAASSMGYAIGPSQTDPRTGEILNADVLISSTFVTGWLYEFQELASPAAARRWLTDAERLYRELPPHLAQRLCTAALGKRHQLGLQHTLLAGLGELDGGRPMPEEYLGDAIRDLVMHEVGHTIGLRHNFKGSSGIPFDRLHDTAFTRRNGVTLSVMDYGPVNVAANRAKQGHYWNKEVGTYDTWAIRYAYAPIYEQAADGELPQSGRPATTPEAELIGLRKIARRASEPLHTYGTDEDNWLGPFALDPLTSAWDLGSDPVRYARERASLVAEVQPQLERRLVEDGDGYQRLRGAMSGLFFERLISLLPATKYVGGVYTARDHKGDPNARPPFRPVSADEQRAAVRLLVEEAFAEDAFSFDADFLNKLAPSRWAHWGVSWFSVPLDYPIHDWVAFVQDVLLYTVLDPYRMWRMIDNEVRVPRGTQPYTLGELFGTLRGAIWTELGDGSDARSVNSFRRNLQRSHVNQLIELLVSRAPMIPEDARSLARLELTELARRLDRALPGGAALDTATRAHLDESRARVERALEAAMTVIVR